MSMPCTSQNININQRVFFVPTERGERMLRGEYDFICMSLACSRFAADRIPAYEEMWVSGCTSPRERCMHLWEFMGIFGKHMHLGADAVIEKNNLRLEER